MSRDVVFLMMLDGALVTSVFYLYLSVESPFRTFGNFMVLENLSVLKLLDVRNID